LLNAALAITIQHLISQVHLPLFEVTILVKYTPIQKLSEAQTASSLMMV